MEEALGNLLLVGGGIISLGAIIWFLIVAFRQRVLWGLACMFVPFAGLVFLIMHWKDARLPFLVVILGVPIFFAGNYFIRDAMHAVDSRVIADVERLVGQELARLGPDSEIYRRYGEYRSLEGSGFVRPRYFGQLIHRVKCNRRAVFANGTADVYIEVGRKGPMSISITLDPSNIENPSNIEVGASHPEFTYD